MIGTMDNVKKQCWSQHISQLVHAYNSTKNDATGYSPYRLMFGREARLPIDICFGISPDGESESSYQQYVVRMRTDLQKAYKLASEAATKSHLQNKARYDQRVRDQPLEVGDRILIQNVGLKGKHKLQDRWKSTPYVVVEKLPNLPVYKVKPECGPGSIKILHRDHLLPIGYLVRMSDSPDEAGPIRSPVTRSKRIRQSQKITQPSHPAENVTPSSDSEFETAPIPWNFDVDEVRRQLEMPSQNPGEDESRDSSEEDESLQEESSEVQENQPVIETESEGSSESFAPSRADSDVQETNNDTAEEQDLERGASSPSSSRARSEGSYKSDRYRSKELSPVRKSQREPKPPMRFTYDKPGSPSSEPVTIMHHGMVIQLKLNPPNKVSSTPRQIHKVSRRCSGDETRKQGSKSKRGKQCDEDIYTVRKGRM
ncbi:uncharacterized protein LOC129347938 [Amphiprion ocellaris]|uniref:uncharacterized protein LOC129347938 n=1 Tax=Amphiprion ocellaris TaxID=80972 RepID=UPI0024118DC0|nr:uncharacterized protein LOC129347938 [Amphiprion ocellaris]